MRERLERSYRLLLLAYPRRYRRYRGAEMLTTLMDLAPPEGARPSVPDAVSILWGGLRCRMSLGRVRKSTALIATVFCMTMGAIAGAALGWQGAATLPDNASAAAMARVAVPDSAATPRDRRDFVFGYDIPVRPEEEVLVVLVGGDDYTAGYVEFTAPRQESLQPARDRLAAAGWQVEGGQDLHARHGQTSLHLAARGEQTLIWVRRATPPLVYVLATAGLVLGALLGWLLCGWIGRRAGRLSNTQKLTATTAFAFGAAALVMPTLFNLLGIAMFYWPAAGPPVPPWLGFVVVFVRGLALLGTSLLLIALLITALPARRRHLVT